MHDRGCTRGGEGMLCRRPLKSFRPMDTHEMRTLPVEPTQICAGLPTEPLRKSEPIRERARRRDGARLYDPTPRRSKRGGLRYGFRSLPASRRLWGGFLVAEAEAGLSSSTIGRRLSAISYAHIAMKARTRPAMRKSALL